MRLVTIILLLATTCLADNFIIATGENGTEEVYVADKMVYTNWLNDTVLWMPFPADKLAGTYYDYSIEGNDGAQPTAGSRPTHSSTNGGVYSFDGNDVINIPQSASFEFGTGDFSISIWVKTSQSGNIEGLVGYGDRADSTGWTMLLFESTARFIIDDSTTQVICNGSGSWADGAWHNFVVVGDRDADLTLYMDGVDIGSCLLTSIGDIDGNDHDEIDIGAYWFDGEYFVNSYLLGLADEPSLWSMALSSNQVNTLYLKEPTIANGGKR